MGNSTLLLCTVSQVWLPGRCQVLLRALMRPPGVVLSCSPGTSLIPLSGPGVWLTGWVTLPHGCGIWAWCGWLAGGKLCQGPDELAWCCVHLLPKCHAASSLCTWCLSLWLGGSTPPLCLFGHPDDPTWCCPHLFFRHQASSSLWTCWLSRMAGYTSGIFTFTVINRYVIGLKALSVGRNS